MRRIFKFRREDEGAVVPDEPEINKLYDEAWEAVDPEVKAKAVGVLRSRLGPDELSEIAKAVDQYGQHEWIHHPPFTETAPSPDPDLPDLTISFHISGGMGIRNLLRERGVSDNMLPKHAMDAYYGEGTGVQNLDDYYVQALEAAAGAR